MQLRIALLLYTCNARQKTDRGGKCRACPKVLGGCNHSVVLRNRTPDQVNYSPIPGPCPAGFSNFFAVQVVRGREKFLTWVEKGLTPPPPRTRGARQPFPPKTPHFPALDAKIATGNCAEAQNSSIIIETSFSQARFPETLFHTRKCLKRVREI